MLMQNIKIFNALSRYPTFVLLNLRVQPWSLDWFYPCMIWPLWDIPAGYDHYGISLQDMTTMGSPCRMWPLQDINNHFESVGLNKMEINAWSRYSQRKSLISRVVISCRDNFNLGINHLSSNWKVLILYIEIECSKINDTQHISSNFRTNHLIDWNVSFFVSSNSA